MLRVPCTICTEILTDDVVACPCGHVYHNNCLVRWLGQREVCPTCRAVCRKANAIRLFFSNTTSPESSLTDGSSQQLKAKLIQQATLSSKKEEENTKLKKQIQGQNKELNELNEQLEKTEVRLTRELGVKEALKQQVECLKDHHWTMENLKMELLNTRTKLEQCERLKRIIEETTDEAEVMVKNIGFSEKSQAELATQLIIMKKETVKMRTTKRATENAKAKADHECVKLKQELKKHEADVARKDDIIQTLEGDIKGLRTKLEAVQKSFQSPNTPRSGIINRLLHESPIPMDIKEMFNENGIEENLFNTNVHITTAEDNLPPPVFPGQFRFGAKKRPLHCSKPIDNTGRKMTVFDGLGGRTTILKPPPAFTKLPPKKRAKVARPTTISKFVIRKNNPDPPLPKMD